jgi:hypothetical protein
VHRDRGGFGSRRLMMAAWLNDSLPSGDWHGCGLSPADSLRQIQKAMACCRFVAPSDLSRPRLEAMREGKRLVQRAPLQLPLFLGRTKADKTQQVTTRPGTSRRTCLAVRTT